MNNKTKKIEVGTEFYSQNWGRIFTVASIDEDQAETLGYIKLRSEHSSPWHCDKKTWESLIRMGSIIIKEPRGSEDSMFETLRDYEDGFFRTAGKVKATSYRIESNRIKERIANGYEKLEDIIYDERQKVAKAQLRASFINDDGVASEIAQGYWSAVELIVNSLTDSKPL